MGVSQKHNKLWTVFFIFFRLGLTSFGGPIAHLAYFREEFVTRRHWLGEKSYADLVALCQFLPGPASSQVGMAVGMSQAGYAGALAAWLGFTMPSAIALILFAYGLTHWGKSFTSDALHGLKIVAFAVVLQAVWGMGRNFCKSAPYFLLMIFSAIYVASFPSTLTQLSVPLIAGIIGLTIPVNDSNTARDKLSFSVSRRVSVISLTLFFVLLGALPVFAYLISTDTIVLFDKFYRAGALVFGGGHVVLPLLHNAVVPGEWVDHNTFLTGYGVAQAIPGPLFTFSAFLGASMDYQYGPLICALICLVAIFFPSFLLLTGALPFWETLRNNPRAQSSLAGINAAVVGLLVAALYNPLWKNTIQQPLDIGLVLLGVIALTLWKLPSWLVLLASVLITILL